MVAFVDWNSQIHAFGDHELDSQALAVRVLDRVSNSIALALNKIASDLRFVVDLRLYHGWHKGFEPTPNRKAVANAVAFADFSALSTKSNVVFSGKADYGDRLLFAAEKRLHQRLAVHLPNTLRSQDGSRDASEKMVDTALAADLVYLASQEPDTWLLVVAEDDDLVPPLFVADALLAQGEGRSLLLRKKKPTGPFLVLDDILCR